MLRRGGSSRSMPKAGSHIATFLCCSGHCLRLSCCESYGRCRLTGGPHGLDDSCKHSKAISSSVLQDKLSKSVEKVCGYNSVRLLFRRDTRIESHLAICHDTLLSPPW